MVMYFHPGGKMPPQLVCQDAGAQVRMDILMAALMTVMVIETRKVAVVKRMGSLPSYQSAAFQQSRVVESGPQYNNYYI
jgi:hypothetical protein